MGDSISAAKRWLRRGRASGEKGGSEDTNASASSSETGGSYGSLLRLYACPVSEEKTSDILPQPRLPRGTGGGWRCREGDVQVMVIGSKGVGKSSLIRTLRGDWLRHNGDGDATGSLPCSSIFPNSGSAFLSLN